MSCGNGRVKRTLPIQAGIHLGTQRSQRGRYPHRVGRWRRRQPAQGRWQPGQLGPGMLAHLGEAGRGRQPPAGAHHRLQQRLASGRRISVTVTVT